MKKQDGQLVLYEVFYCSRQKKMYLGKTQVTLIMKANIKISVHQKDLNAKKQRVQLVSYFFLSIMKNFKLKKF